MTKEWKEWDDEFADEAYDAYSWNDICLRNHEMKWWDYQQATEVSRIQQDVTLIFKIWISQEEKRKIKLFKSEVKESKMHQWKWLQSIKIEDELK